MELAQTYDLLNAALFATSGGSRQLRKHFLGSLGIEPGQRVLELGCGTGQVTELLVSSGAEVTAVDAMPEMLTGARRRAPLATFIEGDVLSTEAGSGYDAVGLAFLPPNFDGGGRSAVLARSREALAPSGRVGILDWALPPGRRRGALWRQPLARIEPSPSVADVIDGAMFAELPPAGFRRPWTTSPAGGRTPVLIKHADYGL